MRPGPSERRGQWRRPSTRRGCFCGRRSRRRPTAAPLDSYAHSVRYTYAACADANVNVPPQPLSRPPPPPGSHLPHRRVSHTRHLVVAANSVHERAPAAAFMPVAATRFAPTPAAAFPPPQPPVSHLPAAARRTYATCRCSAVPRECECQCAPLLFFCAHRRRLSHLPSHRFHPYPPQYVAHTPPSRCSAVPHECECQRSPLLFFVPTAAAAAADVAA
ncbi:hypothetical protein B0H11DRAFT_1972508 [Mycena galericulata]|nr:hypothetical protein B0H11DRAFT_1972508 [Mycena galericulata]